MDYQDVLYEGGNYGAWISSDWPEVLNAFRART